MAIDKGYTCNPETGEVFGPRKNVLNSKSSTGYMSMSIYYNGKDYYLKSHQFIYYYIHRKCVDIIDHIDRDKLNNRIYNLKEATHTQNVRNQIGLGYTFDKSRNKWKSQIRISGKTKTIGRYDTEQEAHQAYLNAKELHHNIT